MKKIKLNKLYIDDIVEIEKVDSAFKGFTNNYRIKGIQGIDLISFSAEPTAFQISQEK